MRLIMRKPTTRTFLAGSVAALALSVPSAFAQEADPAAPVETQMESQIGVEVQTAAPQVQDDAKMVGEAVEEGAETVEDSAAKLAEEAGNTIDMAEEKSEKALKSAQKAVSDPDVWNPKDIESASQTELAESGATMYVIPSAANVRAGAGVANEVVKTIEHGEAVTIYENRGAWTRISADGESAAWIYSPLLTAETVNAKPQVKTTIEPAQADPAPPAEEPMEDDEAPMTDYGESEMDAATYN